MSVLTNKKKRTTLLRNRNCNNMCYDKVHNGFGGPKNDSSISENFLKKFRSNGFW